MLWDFLLEKKTTKQNQHIHQVWSMCCSPEMCVVFGSVKFGLPCWKSGFMCKKNTSVGSYQSESKSRHSSACWNLHFKHFSLSARQWMLRIRWALPWHSTGFIYLLRKCPELYSLWWDVSLPVAGGWSWMSFKVPSNPNHLKKYLSSCFLSFFSWIFRQDCETKDTFCFIFKAKLTLSELEGQQAGRALKFGINLQASL